MSKVPFNQRVKFIAENFFGNNKSQMGSLLGLDYQNINNWIKDKNKPKLEAFLDLYLLIQDRVNPSWYLTGVGEPMLTQSNVIGQVNESPTYQSSYYEKIIAEKNLLISNQQELIELLKKHNK